MRYAASAGVVAGLATFLALDTQDDRNRLISFAGLLAFILIGWLFSKHPSKVNIKYHFHANLIVDSYPFISR